MVTVGVAAGEQATVRRAVAMILERVFVDISLSSYDLCCVQERRRGRSNITNRIPPDSSRPVFFCFHRYFLAFACAGLLYAAPTAVDIGQAKLYFDEARAACEADGSHLWGLSLCGPLMFVERQSRLIVANQPDAKGALKQQDGVFVGALPGGE